MQHSRIFTRPITIASRSSSSQYENKVADPRKMRALGFCVSIAHARFMAAQFVRRGLPATAVSADTSSEEREGALRDLKLGKICTIFCVDLFNEGVDVPEVDTVLFLRPTESSLISCRARSRTKAS